MSAESHGRLRRCGAGPRRIAAGISEAERHLRDQPAKQYLFSPEREPPLAKAYRRVPAGCDPIAPVGVPALQLEIRPPSTALGTLRDSLQRYA